MRLEHEYVARKLNGKMAEFIPVTVETKFELVNNFYSLLRALQSRRNRR